MSADPFTGEFLVPDDPRYAADVAQHLVPYEWCAPRVAGLRVVEIGCGAGYGAARLAASARAVHAYDRNPRAIAWARARYAAPNLSFRQEGADAGPEPGAYDAACSFQVVEHLRRPAELLGRLAALLAPGGIAYVTTPNRLTSAGENIYHVREYDPDELRALLVPHFREVELLGITGGDRFRAYQARRRASMRRYLRLDPLHLRRLVPRRMLAGLFPVLSRRVRESSAPGEALGPEEFEVGAGGLERCDDLFAVCRR